MRIVCAMSGGVDSSVAAALLKDQGYEVIGLFMRLGLDHSPAEARKKSCCSLEDSQDARRVAEILDIPFYSLDYKAHFDRIIDYFTAEYNRGRTPNPCVMCNRWLKFGELLDFAERIEAGAVATGHYARVGRSNGRWELHRPFDRHKDQTYFLYVLRQDQLARCQFPLGELDKDQVRELAETYRLPVHSKPESQEICFVPHNDYRKVLEERTPEMLREGEIRWKDGKLLGTHPGIQYFTIGQRRGLGVAIGKPAYVVELNRQTNTVVLGDRHDLREERCTVGAVNWVSLAPLGPGEEARARVQIRYNHGAQVATLIGTDSPDTVEVRFDEPELAITPGQAAVFYDLNDEAVFGGGFIGGAPFEV